VLVLGVVVAVVVCVERRRKPVEKKRIAADRRSVVAREILADVGRRAAAVVVAECQTENGTVRRHDTRAVQQLTQCRPIGHLFEGKVTD